MMTSPSSPPLGWFSRAAHVLGIGGLLVLGLIGLILPIIPGLLFLFLALLLLARLSSRVHGLVAGRSWFRRCRRSWHRFSLLRAGDRVRLGFWYCARALVNGIESAVNYLARPRERR